MFLIPASYYQVKQTKHKGKGVFATQDIGPGVVIGDYLGTLIRTQDEEKYEKKYGFYAMYYTDYATIFPDLDTDGIHRVNHSCAPNCWMFTYQGHTLYFSLRKIFKGEELTVSYQIGPIDKDCAPCKDVCRCQSILCTGTMHLSKQQYNNWAVFDKKQTSKTKCPPVNYGQTLALLSSYPKSISDHSIYSLFGAFHKKPSIYTDRTLPSKKRLRKRIRETGRALSFPYVHTTVLGVTDTLIITKPYSSRIIKLKKKSVPGKSNTKDFSYPFPFQYLSRFPQS